MTGAPTYYHARYRKLYPCVWKSFRGLSLEEKAIAVYLLTGDQTNRIGLYDFSFGKAIEDLETSPQTFQAGLAHVIDRMNWEYDDVNRVFYIPTWWKWNLPENPSVLKGNLRDLQEVADSPLINKFMRNTSGLEVSKNLISVFNETLATRHPTRVPHQEQEQEQEQKQEQNQEQEVQEEEGNFEGLRSPMVPANPTCPDCGGSGMTEIEKGGVPFSKFCHCRAPKRHMPTPEVSRPLTPA